VKPGFLVVGQNICVLHGHHAHDGLPGLQLVADLYRLAGYQPIRRGSDPGIGEVQPRLFGYGILLFDLLTLGLQRLSGFHQSRILCCQGSAGLMDGAPVCLCGYLGMFVQLDSGVQGGFSCIMLGLCPLETIPGNNLFGDEVLGSLKIDSGLVHGGLPDPNFGLPDLDHCRQFGSGGFCPFEHRPGSGNPALLGFNHGL